MNNNNPFYSSSFSPSTQSIFFLPWLLGMLVVTKMTSTISLHPNGKIQILLPRHLIATTILIFYFPQRNTRMALSGEKRGNAAKGESNDGRWQAVAGRRVLTNLLRRLHTTIIYLTTTTTRPTMRVTIIAIRCRPRRRTRTATL